ncbi:MAG: biotin/lipoyl-binding protein [Candidatus Hydrogenedens sp.]|nr:biotin/lipoyl-binding protein [Candidatus Hydrogenedens sp.]
MTRTIVQIGLVVLILAGGLMGMGTLLSFHEPPAQKQIEERKLRVEVIEVHPETLPVLIEGFGTARSRDVVAITPEVAGTVVSIHPHLEVGEVIPAGEVLFEIDPRNYQAALDQAKAQAERAAQGLSLLKQQFAVDRDRLTTAERSLELSNAEFGRVQKLYTENEVGTQAGVERAEMGKNQAQDARDQLRQAVTLYPIRIQEAESALAAAQAGVDVAQANFDRTTVKAPFDARLTMVKLEAGQFAGPGQPVLMLADDSVIELSVPLDSRDVRSWLRFDTEHAPDDNSWFGDLEKVECTIEWTESNEHAAWAGYVHRVEQFDVQSRTVTVAVRAQTGAGANPNNQLPLVDGMFCKVLIPGREMKDVYRLPEWAVDFDGFAYVASGNRLEKRPVEVVRNQGEFAFVSSGLSPGEKVIVTRVMNPLPNTLLEIQQLNSDGTPTDAPEAG